MADWEMPPDDSESFTPAPPEVAEAAAPGSAPAGEELNPEEGAETEATGTPVPASETSGPASDAATVPDEEELTGDVKRQARKVWAEVNEMGGEPVFQVGKRLASSYLNPRPESAQEFVGDLKAVSKENYWPVRDHIVHETIRTQPDAVLKVLAQIHPDRRAQIERAMQPAAQPEEWYNAPEPPDPTDTTSPSYDPLKDPNMPEAVKRQIREAQELRERIAPLEEKVKAFDQLSTERKAQEVERISQTILSEVMQPVVELIKEAGLEDLEGDPDDVRADKDYARRVIFRDTLGDLQSLPENAPLYEEMNLLIERGDEQGARYRVERARARAERAAQRHVRYHSGRQVISRDSRTKPLTRGTPKLVPEAAPAGIPTTPRPGPAFDQDQHHAALQDIKARVS